MLTKKIDQLMHLQSTSLEWEDLMLPPNTRDQLDGLVKSQARGDANHSSLFHGPPGTGKTLAATLIGAAMDRATYRIDLSTVVSKYIGETEKNLATVFDRAAETHGILLFLEAGALFGTRTDVRDAHDHYANQEVSYLVQRLERHSGLVILTTNNLNTMDSAFTRRFHSTIYFPLPTADERIRLWKRAFRNHEQLNDTIDFAELSHRYELTGSAIRNVAADLARVSRISIQDIERRIATETANETR